MHILAGTVGSLAEEDRQEVGNFPGHTELEGSLVLGGSLVQGDSLVVEDMPADLLKREGSLCLPLPFITLPSLFLSDLQVGAGVLQ